MLDLKERIKKLSHDQRRLLEKRLEATGSKSNSRKFIVPLKEGNPSKYIPIYCPHPPLGAAAYYLNIGRHLDPEQPFYGIQSPAFNYIREPFDTMEEMAAYYVQAIRTLQPTGQFILMGHSSGANIAFEMVVQLEKKGESVPILVLVDAEAPIGEPSELTIAFKNAGPTLYESAETLFLCAWCVSLAHNLALPFSKEDLDSLEKKARYQRVRDYFKEAGFIPENASSDLVNIVLKMVYNHTLADISYFEKNTPDGPKYQFNGKTLLFRCTEETKFEGFDIVSQPDTSDFSNWDKFCKGPIDVIGVPNSNHVTIITEPAVKIMAEKLQTYLDKINLLD